MLRYIDELFIKSPDILYGLDRIGEIVPFAQANFRGFGGEGRARDAMILLRQRGVGVMNMARLEMRVVRRKQASEIAWGRTFVIFHEGKENHSVYGENHLINGHLRTTPLTPIPFVDLNKVKLTADSYAKRPEGKIKGVRLATWNLYAL